MHLRFGALCSVPNRYTKVSRTDVALRTRKCWGSERYVLTPYDSGRRGRRGPPVRWLRLRCGGGDSGLPDRLGFRAMPMELWSFEKGSVSAGVGFVCARDVANSLLYATLMSEGEAPGISDATKSAIRTLLDLAEACSTRKIIMGLSPEHASCEGLACSLLRLGFQVISVRKCPVLNAASESKVPSGTKISWPFKRH
eukprot:g23350.t1